MKTRERIVETARELFNGKGSFHVTTNHIAAEMGISPGNLYYHFRNKEEVIREIFGKIVEDFDLLYAGPKETELSATGFFRMFVKMCDLYYKYRFFYLELAPLLGQDPILKKRYASNMRRRFTQQQDLYAALSRAGIIKPSSGEELLANFTNGWIISDFWLTWLYISGEKITPERVGAGTRQIYYLLKPHLSDTALAEIEKTLAC